MGGKSQNLVPSKLLHSTSYNQSSRRRGCRLPPHRRTSANLEFQFTRVVVDVQTAIDRNVPQGHRPWCRIGQWRRADPVGFNTLDVVVFAWFEFAVQDVFVVVAVDVVGVQDVLEQGVVLGVGILRVTSQRDAQTVSAQSRAPTRSQIQGVLGFGRARERVGGVKTDPTSPWWCSTPCPTRQGP